MNERETANKYAGQQVTEVAKGLHDRSIFAAQTQWDDVDPVMRERRIAQAHDLVTLGYVQRINEFYPVNHAPEEPQVEPDYVGDEERLR